MTERTQANEVTKQISQAEIRQQKFFCQSKVAINDNGKRISAGFVGFHDVKSKAEWETFSRLVVIRQESNQG